MCQSWLAYSNKCRVSTVWELMCVVLRASENFALFLTSVVNLKLPLNKGWITHASSSLMLLSLQTVHYSAVGRPFVCDAPSVNSPLLLSTDGSRFVISVVYPLLWAPVSVIRLRTSPQLPSSSSPSAFHLSFFFLRCFWKESLLSSSRSLFIVQYRQVIVRGLALSNRIKWKKKPTMCFKRSLLGAGEMAK